MKTENSHALLSDEQTLRMTPAVYASPAMGVNGATWTDAVQTCLPGD